MKIFKKAAYVFLLNSFLINCMSSYCLAGAGASSGQILAYNPNPVTIAMGDGGCALLLDKPSAAILNPASTIGAYRIVASVNNASLFSDIQYNHIGAQFPTEIGNIGLSAMYAGYGNIDYTDSLGNPIKEESSNDLGFILNYAIDLKKTIPIEALYGGIGINLKVIRGALCSYETEAIAVDAGTILSLSSIDNFYLGVALKNFGTKLKFLSESFNLPQCLAVGLAYQEDDFYNFKVALDYNNQLFSDDFFSIGASFEPIYFLDLRAGLKLTEDSFDLDARFGFGVDFQNLNIDYSYVPQNNLVGTHSITLSCALGRFTSEKVAYDYYMQNHFREAVNLYNKKDYIQAKKEFDDILSVYPEHVKSQMYLKKINNKLAEVELYNAEIINGYMRKANNALKKGDIVKAKENFNKVLDMDSVNLLAKKGLEQADDYSNQVSIEMQRDKNRARIEYLWDRSQKFYKEGDLVHARKYLGLILDLDSKNKPAQDLTTTIDNHLAKAASDKIQELYKQGIELFEKGKYQESIMYFQAIVIASPNRRDVKDLIEKAQKGIEELNKYDKNKKSIILQNKMIKELENNFNKALKYYDKRDFVDAMNYFKISKEIADKYSFVDYSKKAQEHIVKIGYDLSDIYYKKGLGLSKKNNFEQALKEYKKALEYNSENSLALFEYKRIGEEIAQQYYQEGMRFYSIGNFNKASELLRKSLTYNPDKMEAKRALEKMR
ncbi:MAG: PorV/PorQ family protein [Endomicrobium sp.]|uniref:PorV/PorQ family protein n=1 Tax=Candidatus Endomicrobiellum cubanum TaxID=3242325 RepID=UPI00281E4D65|nr:PorV/PorQ family protein [Endomicrobium sp.]